MMKTKTLASTYLFILVLIIGAILAAPLNAATVEANVQIEPDRVDLGAEYPRKFMFTIWFSGKYKNYNVSDIDPKTVLVEGVLKPPPGKGLWKAKDNTVTFKIKGVNLINIIWQKVFHMAHVDPNPKRGTWFPYNVDITVTGEFYDGTRFTGTDTIKAYAPQGTEYPPPNSQPL